jgi:iduronate 2-sulfatase
MTRYVVLLAAVTFFARGPAATAEEARARPNVLFIAVDDLRQELGCYGVKEIQSPHIDALARSGVTFTRAYCQQAVCNPSRASLLTGLRPDSTRVWDLVTPLRTTIPDVVTLPQYFRLNGYHSVGMGKIYHNIFPDPLSWSVPEPKPANVTTWSPEALARLREFKEQMRKDGKTPKQVERMRGPATEARDVADNRYIDGALADLAVGQLRDLKQRKEPWFLGVGFIRPHLPFVAPKKYWDLYDPARIPLAANPFLPKGAPALAMFGMYELRDYMDFATVKDPPVLLAEDQARRLKHGYYAAVSFVDAQIGKVLAELTTLGLDETTIVILWSDHGWKLGEHASWCKQTNYEIDACAPLMVRVPGAKGNGRQSRALVEFVDIYPTLCDLAGLPLPTHLEGKSFRAVLDDPAAAHKAAAISQFPRRQPGKERMGYAMRTDRYRYVEWLDRANGQLAEVELYDHATDPAENENVAGQERNSKLLQELSEQLWRTIPRPSFQRPKAPPR